MDKTIIASLTEDGVIGVGNKLPWQLPEEMEHFKNTTLNSAVIMGRRTYESLKRPLVKRLNIVLSAKMEGESENVRFAKSINQAIDIADNSIFEKLFIIGGETVYRGTIPIADELILSFVHGSFRGDKFFPLEMIDDFSLVEAIEKESFTVKYYKRKNVNE
jgi:dihydrofolate reductase